MKAPPAALLTQPDIPTAVDEFMAKSRHQDAEVKAAVGGALKMRKGRAKKRALAPDP